MTKRIILSLITFVLLAIFLLWSTGNLTKVIAALIPSKVKVDFEKGGERFIKEVAPYPEEIFWDTNVPIYKTANGIEYVRTPDTHFENLSGYNFEPNYIDIDGLRMHYIAEGPEDGEVILLLHGQPTWAYLYRKMIKGLIQQGYRCIAPDMIGMGRSDKPIKEDFQYIPSPLEVNPDLKFPNDLLKHGLKGGPEAFQGWILFSLQNPHNYYGKLIQRMTVKELTSTEVTAYEAPFPSFIYRAGPRMLPSMVAGIVGQQLPAWENLQKFDKPFISFIGLKDRLLGRPEIQEKWMTNVPGAKGQAHEQFENANHFIQEDIGEIMVDRVHQFMQKNPI